MNLKKINNIFNKISIEEQIGFAKNLAVLLRGGVTINEAVASLASKPRQS